jgi:hypothetical protein
LDSALTDARRCRHVHLVGVEVPHNGFASAQILDLSRRPGQALTVYVEVPVRELTVDLAKELAKSGLRVKLRTGGIVASAFPSERDLVDALMAIVAADLTFKCTAGLHKAVRHRDHETAFEHHGFLNIALAMGELCRDGSRETVQAVLAESDADRLTAATRQMTSTEIADVRSLFQSFGTCSVVEPLSDLLTMGLVQAP